MKLLDLVKQCTQAINQVALVDIPDAKPHIYLRMSPARQERPTRKLVPSGKAPIGKVLSRNGDFDVVAFEAVDVLAWCVANSGGTIQVTEGE
jgi:hypothetical protein